MTVETDSTFDEVIKILTDFTDNDEPIKGSHRLLHDLELDSVKVMELMMLLEDHFDISIPLNVLPAIETVTDLSNAIIKLKQ